MPCNVAQVSSTMAHIAEKTVFFHSEFGIRAGFPRSSCTCIQSIKRGIVASVNIRSRIFAGLRRLELSSDIKLSIVRVNKGLY